MRKTSLFISAALLLFCSGLAQGQEFQTDTTQKQVNYSVSIGGIAATDKTPFWLRANQFGVIPFENSSFLPGLSLGSNYLASRKWDWGFNVEAVGNIGKNSTILLPEAHVKGRWGKLELLAGRKRQIVGLVGDSINTSGSYIQSGNSLPIPMIQLSLIDYVPILKGLFAFRGNFVHGWFDSNPITKNHYLHQKSLYVRFGKPNWPVRLYGGFNHNVQWGGKIVTSNRWTAPGQTSYPSKWIDYWYVISGKRIPTFDFVDPKDYDAIDRGNRLGNHLGSVDLGVELQLSRAWNMTLYKQSIYDDGSLFQLINIQDGLYGLSLKNKTATGTGFHLAGVTVEYLYTVYQGGNYFDLNGGRRGMDDYFNHMQYYGWVYAKNTVGTPFITPHYQVGDDLPASSDYMYSNNNRVKMLHLGLNGNINRLSFILKLSHSQNLGTYARSFPKNTDQTSAFLKLTLPIYLNTLGRIETSVALATDIGKLYPNSSGVILNIKKYGVF